MIECPEYTLTLPPPCPTNRDHLSLPFTGRTVPNDRIPIEVLLLGLPGIPDLQAI